MEIKKIVFTKIKEKGIEIVDNPHSRKQMSSYPFVLIRTSNIMTKERNGMIEKNYIFLLDIYSNYSGEKEVYELYESILEALEPIKNINEVARVIDNGMRVIDDNTLGPLLKHGILTVNIKTIAIKEEV